MGLWESQVWSKDIVGARSPKATRKPLEEHPLAPVKASGSATLAQITFRPPCFVLFTDQDIGLNRGSVASYSDLDLPRGQEVVEEKSLAGSFKKDLAGSSKEAFKGPFKGTLQGPLNLSFVKLQGREEKPPCKFF